MILFAFAVGLADILGHAPGFTPLLVLTLLAVTTARFIPPAGWRYVFGGMLALSVLIAALAIAQVIAGYTFFAPRARGPFGSPNFLSYYAVLHFFLALYMRAGSRWQRLWGACAAANLVALALSQSLGSVLGITAGMAVIVVSRYPRRVPEFLALASLSFAALANLTFVSATRPTLLSDPRIGIWLQGLRIAHWRLLFGYGQRNFFVLPNYTHFYNVGIEALVAAGVVGLAAGVWMLWSGFRATRHLQKKEGTILCALLVAWSINGMFIYNTTESVLPLYAVLAYLRSVVNRDVADRAALIDKDEPLVHGAFGSRHAG